jgi:hypothetical protein
MSSLTLAALLASGLLAQSPVFEVSSVKPSGPNRIRVFDGGPGSHDPGRISYTRATLAGVIGYAWDLTELVIAKNGPKLKKWVEGAPAANWNGFPQLRSGRPSLPPPFRLPDVPESPRIRSPLHNWPRCCTGMTSRSNSTGRNRRPRR